MKRRAFHAVRHRDLLRSDRWAVVALSLPLGHSLVAEDAVLPGTKLWNFPQGIVAEQYQELRTDQERCALYGFSHGGYTAIQIGPGEPRFKVVIDSGNFNDITSKYADLTLGTSFLLYRDGLETCQFGWLNTLCDSILASLIAPRTFMVEEGDHDPVVVEPRRLVDAEIARLLDLYRKLGIPERFQVDNIPGAHQVHGVAPFAFLDKWLKEN